jgi:DNA-binding transcriptional MocR family regulator
MSQFSEKVVPGVTNLTVGAPGPDLLERAADIFKKSSESFTCSDSDEDTRKRNQLFQYGPNCGTRVFLDAMAGLLSEQYNDEVEPERIMLTCGATHGLHLAASTLMTHSKGIVFVENPTYFIALDILERDLGLRSVAIDMTYDGIDVDALESALRSEVANRRDITDEVSKFWAMVYLVPTFHNPTGVSLSPAKCEKIIDLASKYNLLVVCDDVYNMLYYDGVPTKRFIAYDKNSCNIISNGTFSKIMAPGVRVGWIEASPELIKKIAQVGVLQSGGAVNNVMSGILAKGMTLGLQRDNLDFLRREYGLRMTNMCDLLVAKLPQGFHLNKRPRGGYFIWVNGPTGFDATNFADFCHKKHQVQVLPGLRATANRSTTRGYKCVNSFRLSIAYYGVYDLERAAERLCEALTAYSVVSTLITIL